MVDLVIRGAVVVDRVLGPRTQACRRCGQGRQDRRHRFRSATRATRPLTPTGLVLSPGHRRRATPIYDAQVTWDATLSPPSPSLGVTTAVIGNCGFGIVPGAGPPWARTPGDPQTSRWSRAMDLDALRPGPSPGYFSRASATIWALLRRKGAYANLAVLARPFDHPHGG